MVPVGVVDDPQAGRVIAEQFGRPFGDRVEHVTDRQPVRDRTLDPEEPLQQRLALLEDGDKPLVLLHGRQRLGVQRPLVAEGPQHAQRLTEHPAHAPQEQRLVGVERISGAGDEQPGRAIDGNGHDGAVAEAGHLEDGRRAHHRAPQPAPAWGGATAV